MANLLRFLGFFYILLLQACQYHTMKSFTQKNKEAAYYNIQLALAYLQQGNIPRAKSKLLTALDLSPNSPETLMAMAYFLEKTHDKKEASAYYKKALSLSPDNGTYLNNYGTFLCRKASYVKAEQYFLKAVKDSHYLYTAEAYENAGLCTAAIPDYVKAKKYFLEALAHDPRRKKSLYELVSIDLRQKNPELALDHLKQYHKLTRHDTKLNKLAKMARFQLKSIQ